MTDRDLLQHMIARIGKKPRAVRFDKNEHLVGLNLAGLDLEELPEEVLTFAHLHALWMDETTILDVKKSQRVRLGNQLVRVPPELGQLADLQTLRLDGNRLGSVPAELGRLTNLRRLSLSNNQLGSVPVELGQLVKLQELRLDGNQLGGVPTELGQLTNLRRLSLSNNQLGSVPVELGQLVKLQELRLDGNQLGGVPTELGQLTNLQRLSLSNNQLNCFQGETRRARWYTASDTIEMRGLCDERHACHTRTLAVGRQGGA